MKISRREAERLIPLPDWQSDTHHENGRTGDIINVILFADSWDNHRAARSMRDIAEQLRSATVYDTLRSVWNFVHTHIRYKADSPGHEQVKDPAYLYHYGVGDCKSFSLMIGSILRNYKDVGYSYRFVAYEPGEYTHVYVIANIPGRKLPVILDAVHTAFNDEVKYTKKLDKQMTKISHLHATPAYLQRKQATIGELAQDAPRSIYKESAISFGNLSQAEIELRLLRREAKQLAAYYGTNNNNLKTSISILESAIKNPAQIEIPNYLPSGLNWLADKVISISKKYTAEIQQHAEILGLAGIGRMTLVGPNFFGITAEQLADCIKKLAPKELTYEQIIEENGFYFSNGKTLRAERDFNGTKPPVTGGYAYSGQLVSCIEKYQRLQWSKNNVFENAKFKEGSHHMLYSFADDDLKGSFNDTGFYKSRRQLEYVVAFAAISGADQAVVDGYIKTGIQYTSALNKLDDITPRGSMLELRAEGTRINALDPVTAALVYKIVVAAISAIAALLGTVLRPYQNDLNRRVADLGTNINSPEPSDFKKELNSLQLQNMIIPIGAGLAAFLLLNRK